MNPLYTTATALHDAGIVVTPVRTDGTKAPIMSGFQEHKTTAADIHTWFSGDRPRHGAMGIVCGPISGNLEMTEIEGEYVHRLSEVQQLAQDTGLGELLDALAAGWVERSPSGGFHWIYRVKGMEVPGNKKLAQDKSRLITPTDGRKPYKTFPPIAETRGRGGQFVAYPTGANGLPPAHDTGRPWERISGGPDTMVTLTVEEREAFHALLGTLDEREAELAASMGEPRKSEVKPVETMTGILGQLENTYKQRLDGQGSTPGDDFEARTEWTDILEPEGWTRVYESGGTTYWCRPGKRGGISATTGRDQDRDRLFVFTTSTEFPDFEPITKFGAYALLHHNGDHSKAAAALRGEGFGQPARVQHPSAASKATTPPATAGIGVDSGTGTPVTATPQPQGSTGWDIEVPAAPVLSTQPGEVHATGNVVALPEQQPKDHTTPLQLVTTTLDMTDDANAMELIRHCGDRLRYDVDRDHWLVWDVYRWEPQPSNGGAARELAKSVARQLPENGPEGESKALKHKRYSLSERGTTAMLNTARTDPAILVRATDLDARPYELNTPGGIVDLRTGDLLPPDPAKLHSRSTNVTPDPAADATMWDRFLEQALPDTAVRTYVQRLVGHSIIGEVLDHVLPFAHGDGGNGKGVFLETLRGVLGTYGGAAPQGFLMETRNNPHPTELADLNGRRFVISSEVKHDDRFNEAKVKALTGGDTVKGRFMRKDFVEFEPSHHIWLMGNDQPEVKAGGYSFWRRLRLIPFTNKVRKDEVIEGLQKILATEHGAAVLWWAVQGAVDYLKHGLQEPEGVRAATDAYASSADTIGRFIQETCVLLPTSAVPVFMLRSAYESWCRAAGETPLNGREFTAQLERHGITAGRNAPKGPGGQRLYGGVQLIPRVEPQDQEPQGHLFDGDRGGY